MSSALPTTVRALSRTGIRVLASGALAIGLLTSAPSLPAHAAAAHHHHRTKHHVAAHHAAGKAAPRVARAMRVALHQKGDPYVYGAAGPNRFDCSGLTYFSFRHAGFKHIPRTSAAQSHFAKRESRGAMRRGDLIFFYDGGGVYHVGVYAGFNHGRRWVLHAPYSGARVRTDKLWTNSWFPGTLRYR